MTAEDVTTVVPVVMTTVMQTLALKQEQEITTLMNWLNDPARLRDFKGFNQAVQDMQASIRAIDILSSSVLATAFETGRDLYEQGKEDNKPAIPSFLSRRGEVKVDRSQLEGEEPGFTQEPIVSGQTDRT